MRGGAGRDVVCYCGRAGDASALTHSVVDQKQQPVEDSNCPNRNDPSFWPLIGLVLLASVAAISGQSLWIDEAITAWQASLPSLKECWRQMIADRGSELQMPLFMVFLWSWERVFGPGEIALRTSNLPWMLLGFGTLLKAIAPEKKLRIGVTLATAFSPFIWFYLNEARPYIMQLSGSFLVFAGLCKLCSQTALPKRSQRNWSITLATGMFIVCASSMLGVLWVGAALVAASAIVGKRRAWDRVKSSFSIWLCAFVALAFLGIYYVWTLQYGARASGAAGTNWKNLIFIAYEFFGLNGLGPGRNLLRQAGPGSLLPFMPLLMSYMVVLAIVIFIGLRERTRIASNRTFIVITGILFGTLLSLLVMGYVAHFRVLGRHVTPLVVAFLFFLGFSIWRLWERPGFGSKIIIVAFIGLNIFSCLSLRFASRHEKDDYRSAAQFALSGLADGKTVWWNADRSGALYYGVPLSEKIETGKAWLIRNPQPDGQILVMDPPEVVIQSKPDIYDFQKGLGIYLNANKYQLRTNLPAFLIWEK